MSASIIRRPDVVTILWQRNLLTPFTPTIVEATVIGSAKPCNLNAGQSLITASICLLSNRFVLVSNIDLGVFGISEFVRLF
ncbi:hypothetical protein JNUCC23_09360 [Peribacillus sp. JNUCC 23]|uniref:hypothetical protein n=1 Tax=Peribacillus sp. NPDC096379 TaxID=3364393 RepID=UPI0007834B0B